MITIRNLSAKDCCDPKNLCQCKDPACRQCYGEKKCYNVKKYNDYKICNNVNNDNKKWGKCNDKKCHSGVQSYIGPIKRDDKCCGYMDTYSQYAMYKNKCSGNTDHDPCTVYKTNSQCVKLCTPVKITDHIFYRSRTTPDKPPVNPDTCCVAKKKCKKKIYVMIVK